MESVTDMVADQHILSVWDVRELKPTYRLATPSDELHITTAFSRMLRELEPLGHDVLPTDSNLDLLWKHVFEPALQSNQHAILLAFAEGECIGATFYVPETSVLDTHPKRVTAYGLYVVPPWRCRAVGTSLQEVAHAHLRKLGFHTITSQVLTRNGNGVANCMRMGYINKGYIVELNLQEQEVKHG